MRTTLLMACASVFAASTAFAQDYGGYNQPVAYNNGTEEVIVTAPPNYHTPSRSSVTGAPIEDVALSQGVRFDDLDLTTREGARELHDRVRETARKLCRRLDVAYPISADGSPPCYRTAVEGGLAQADAAIEQARQY